MLTVQRQGEKPKKQPVPRQNQIEASGAVTQYVQILLCLPFAPISFHKEILLSHKESKDVRQQRNIRMVDQTLHRNNAKSPPVEITNLNGSTGNVRIWLVSTQIGLLTMH
jgi:hypothetical protein